MYRFLKKIGYNLVFKPVVQGLNGKIKGNCDGELILHVMKTFEEYESAIIVTGDGDFYCIVEYWIEQEKFLKVLVLAIRNYSSLLKKLAKENMSFVSDLRRKIEYTKK